MIQTEVCTIHVISIYLRGKEKNKTKTKPKHEKEAVRIVLLSQGNFAISDITWE